MLALPKNKTGLFAGDTLQEAKLARNNHVTIPPLTPQYRQNSFHLLLASAEQNHHHNTTKEQQHLLYIEQSKNYQSAISSKDIQRNGFRPSNVKHGASDINRIRSLGDTSLSASRVKSAAVLPMAPSTNISNNRSTFINSRASAKLKSEIGEMSERLRKTNERLNSNEDVQMFIAKQLRDDRLVLNGPSHVSPSVMSSSPSCRISSASVISPSLQQERYSSAITTLTGNTITESHTTPATVIPVLHPSHSYQVPQQSNVGSESVLLRKTPTPRNKPSISCPYYVMYFTQMYLKKQQKDAIVFPKNNTNSSNSLYYPSRRGGRISPLSMMTYNSAFDDRHWLDHKRQINNKNKRNNGKENEQQSSMKLSNRITMFENETVHQLQDLLRTSSWNHVQV
ncbi:unnamed protein product [Didymodactylos carnosus]|uniref:Uncharacterized protein n=1 Tax=Didymodactylos carnosus TaxID=1234261 RepID=A0A813P253_9BILA|nr:unnamed protein product [Didymodactylos carnosus]CAF0886961.1 unnamed protein product [Didymodactylos carnosus]CAF3527911.1 unnamed protein product [Didymodactylos carnosus]CAF3669887.1 unnamed protein product [Didymodactylos carnosus]